MGPDDLYVAHKHFLMMAIYNVPDTRRRTFKCVCVGDHMEQRSLIIKV